MGLVTVVCPIWGTLPHILVPLLLGFQSLCSIISLSLSFAISSSHLCHFVSLVLSFFCFITAGAWSAHLTSFSAHQHLLPGMLLEVRELTQAFCSPALNLVLVFFDCTERHEKDRGEGTDILFYKRIDMLSTQAYIPREYIHCKGIFWHVAAMSIVDWIKY